MGLISTEQRVPADRLPPAAPIHWSNLKYLRESPLHFRHVLMAEWKDTPAMRIGRAIHSAALEPLRLGREYVVYEGARRGNAWKEFLAVNGHVEILTASEWDRVEGAVTAIQDRRISWITSQGLTEHTIEWTEPRVGMACAGRVDRVVNGVLVEIKSSAIWGERQFASHAAKMGYHLQAAWYCEGLRAAGIDVIDEVIIIAVQSVSPHDVAVYRLPEEAILAGRAQIDPLVERLHECIQTDEWPGVAEGEHNILSLPAWAGLEEAETIEIDGEEWRA